MASQIPRATTGAHRRNHRLISPWGGHLPITSEMLLPILQRAASGANDFTYAERILYTACEFRAAVAARTIVTHLGSETRDNLHNAILAFTALGALRFASALSAALCALTDTPTKRHLYRRLRALENDLIDSKESIDHLIADFAEKVKQACGARAVVLCSSTVVPRPRLGN
jgi:hypothetical protein